MWWCSGGAMLSSYGNTYSLTTSAAPTGGRQIQKFSELRFRAEILGWLIFLH